MRSLSLSAEHPNHDLMIYCKKCGGLFVWHTAQDAQWMKCLGCGDLHDLADPGTRVGEIAKRGQRERRV